MQALVLVGGEGTRLRPLTSLRPKPVVPLVDRPFIRYMIDWLARHGVTEVVLACGFRADSLRAELGESVPGGPSLRYLSEPEPRGTAGAIKFAADVLEDRFLALNGDLLTDLDLTALVGHHEQAGAVATLGLVGVDDPSAFGLVRRDDAGVISEFLEKPTADQIDTDEVNAGCYVLQREVLDLVPEGQPCSIEREVFPRLVGHGLHGVRLEGYWKDIGTPETYLQATRDVLVSRVETDLTPRLGTRSKMVESDVEVGSGAVLVPPVAVLSGASVGANARVGPNTVVAAGARVGADATVERSVVLAGAAIGARSVVRDAILAPGAQVGEDASATDGAVVGEGVTVGHGNHLARGIRVSPGVELPPDGVRFGPPARKDPS
ncbi:MAG: sugar phosphate nucleotidyltransferase [Solirubrobacterales bacterium]